MILLGVVELEVGFRVYRWREDRNKGMKVKDKVVRYSLNFL